MNPTVNTYFEKLQPWQTEVCNELRKVAFSVIPDVEERLQYGKPHYLKNGHYAAVIHAAKDKISFMLFNAGALPDVKGFFQSTTSPDRKIATIKESMAVDYQQLKQWLKETSKSL
jgi:hypothetical protein